jgi:uncharacterized membrane protein YphA (DoxX/SURF4 family)
MHGLCSRIVLASNISLHGLRHLFGAFPQLGGRRGAPIALDVLLLLIVGLFTSFTALLLCAELLTAYFYAAVPRSVWPIPNGGNHVLLYFLAFLYTATAGPGRWSLDALRKVAAHRRPAVTRI